MTTATNYSDLSPAMKTALLTDEPWMGHKATAAALERRGYITLGRSAEEPVGFTNAGQRAREALQAAETAELSAALRSVRVEPNEKVDEIEQARREMDAAFAKLERLTTLRDKLTEARDALKRVFADLDRFDANQRAVAVAQLGGVERIRSELAKVDVRAIDPTRPGWFMVGQGISNYHADTHHRVVIVEHDKHGKVSAVAATLNNGYGGGYYWYGYHPQAVKGLDFIEGPHIGLRDEDRRNWPSNASSALRAVRDVMTDQVLSGYAHIAGATTRLPTHITVALPMNTEPTRHLELLRRYVPYRCRLETARNYGADIIRILPPKD